MDPPIDCRVMDLMAVLCIGVALAVVGLIVLAHLHLDRIEKLQRENDLLRRELNRQVNVALEPKATSWTTYGDDVSDSGIDERA